jgi:hypothetical protein
MSDVQACQAYVHVLEAEVARMRIELADYKHTYDVEVVEHNVGDGLAWYMRLPSWRRDEINRYMPIKGPTLKRARFAVAMTDIERQNMRLLCSWIGSDVNDGTYLDINHNWYGTFRMVASTYKYGAFAIHDGTYLEFWMTTENAERVVRDIAAHFNIRVE